jgi:hypothetical protein
MSNKTEFEVLNILKAYRDACDKNDPDAMDVASDAFEEKILDIDNMDRINELRYIFEAMSNGKAKEAFEELANSAKKFGELKDAFAIGKAMAEGGKEDLFFPSVAAELATVSGTLKALKTAADALKDNLDNLGEAWDAEDVDALIKELKVSKTEVETLLGAFEDLKDAVTGD